MISGYRPSWWTLLASLLLHAIGIGLLMTLRSSEPLRVHSARVTLITPRVHIPSPVSSQPLRPPVRSSPRIFRVPDRLPRPAVQPRVTLIISGPPSIPPPDALPPAPAPGIVEPPPALVVKAAGFSSLETSGASPVRRAPAATGAFEAAAATPDRIAPNKISPGNFGDASVVPAGPRASQGFASPNLLAAEILSKPRPAYTDEARRLRIEGEVQLEVLFGASGEVRVLRTIRGLGHGLDENAIAAARDIRFRPAQRGGAAVDSSAVVHIVFQLAY